MANLNLTAGENITLEQDGNNLVVSSTGGGTASDDIIVISDTEPQTEDTKLWIDTGAVENLGSEIHVGSTIDNNVLTNIVIGKNVFNKNNVQWYRNANENFLNTNNDETTRIRTTSFEIEGGKTYIVSGIPSDITLYRVRTFSEYNGTQVDNITPSNNTFTLNSNIKYIHLLFSGSNFTSDTNTLMANANIMINEGNVALPYEEFIVPSIIVDGKEIYNQIKITNYTYTGTTSALSNLITNISATNKIPIFADIGTTSDYTLYIKNNYIGVKIANNPDTSVTVTIYCIELG